MKILQAQLQSVYPMPNRVQFSGVPNPNILTDQSPNRIEGNQNYMHSYTPVIKGIFCLVLGASTIMGSLLLYLKYIKSRAIKCVKERFDGCSTDEILDKLELSPKQVWRLKNATPIQLEKQLFGFPPNYADAIYHSYQEIQQLQKKGSVKKTVTYGQIKL